MRSILWRTLCLTVLAAAGPSAALGDAWFPHPANAEWSYHWTDSTYNPQGTTDTVTVDSVDPVTCGWQLQWTGDVLVPVASAGAGGQSPPIDQPDDGTACFADENSGLLSTGWSADAPPGNEPSLCRAGAQCVNSLGSVVDDLIWGARTPVISEPLLRGTTWGSTGGQDGTVTSQNEYLGHELVRVPAFPNGIVAAVTRSQITLDGAPGDDYGSGTRTTWWAFGVGPVKVVFDHVDGSVTSAQLTATNLLAAHPPADQDYFPMKAGLTGTYEWTNHRYLKAPEIEKVTAVAAAGRTARFTVTTVSGPIRATGADVFSLRLDGLRNTAGSSAAAARSPLPRLGRGLQFLTPLDLMTYGFNPVLPAYPTIGSRWTSGDARDTQLYGVVGTSRLVGVRTVHVPAGRFSALEVRSTLTQPGHRFGSGLRTMWLSPTRGLVKLVFDHADGSVSTIQLLAR